MIDIDEPFKLMTQGMVKDEYMNTCRQRQQRGTQALSLSLMVVILCVLPFLCCSTREVDFDWDEKVVAGANRFIKRAWRV